LCEVVALDDYQARAAGQLCGLAGTSDVVDASVALVARQRGAAVVTSDPAELRRLDGGLDLVAI
jgi:predicted nucleic acid-binding protein